MSENTEESVVQDAETVEEKKGGSNKLLFILLPVLLIVGLVAGFFLAPLIKGKDHGEKEKTEHESTETSSEKEKKEAIDPKKIAFVNIPDVLVNLKSKNKSPVFLKIAVVLEIHEPEKKEAIENFKPKIIDQMQTFLRDLDITDVTGTNNLNRLRQELKVRINNVISPLKTEDVLIKEFLVQ